LFLVRYVAFFLNDLKKRWLVISEAANFVFPYSLFRYFVHCFDNVKNIPVELSLHLLLLLVSSFI
jgi:hypothetical protein